ncbi:hypothetical protein [Daejeonella sp.]|jgi:hypothetical protein|uniref:hypothetical protein n=1 Tax=Daejeonella sp. TaxID=2805397 RepID=UPI0037C0F1FA
MNLKSFFPLLFLVIVLLFGCGTEEPKEEVKPIVKKIMQPFRFHKAIEVRPGLTLDIVSWGRGSNSVGGYLILRSDSTQLNYRSVAGELDGKIMDAWDMDLDSDGNPELYIHAKGEGKGSYLSMYIYEYADNGSNQQLRFPELSSSLNEGYRGNDSVYIKDGKLLRQFPVYNKNDSTGTKTGEIRKIEYVLRNNNFQYKELKEDNLNDKKNN